MNVIANPLGIRSIQLRAQIHAVKLEKAGMRRSGGNLTPKLKRFYGLPRSAKHDDVLASLRDELQNVDEQFLRSSEDGARA